MNPLGVSPTLATIPPGPLMEGNRFRNRRYLDAPVEEDYKPALGGGVARGVEERSSLKAMQYSRAGLQTASRIAYWSYESRMTITRDIWTVPANGGEPTPVTEDAHVDWNPVWSPDGKYLYFSSDRGGSHEPLAGPD